MSPASRPLTRWHWIVPAVLLAAGTAVLWNGELDRSVARAFYSPTDPTHWPQGYEEPWAFLYHWGVFPAIGLAAVGLLLLAWTNARGKGDAKAQRLRLSGLTIVLGLALGPLLLINGVLHESWGRPRPRQVMEFAGSKTFRPLLRPIWDPGAQSFPTGHAAAGYGLVVVYFALRQIRPRVAWLTLAAALGVGSATAWARMAQGGHWLSDGLWSAGIVWFSAWAVAWVLERRHADSPPIPPGASPSGNARPWIAAAYGGGAVVLCMGYLAFLPVMERMDREVALAAAVREVQIESSGPPAEVHLLSAPGTVVRLTATLSGRGAPWVGLADRWEPQAGPAGSVRGQYAIAVKGYRRGQNLELWVAAPPGVNVTLRREPEK